MQADTNALDQVHQRILYVRHLGCLAADADRRASGAAFRLLALEAEHRARCRNQDKACNKHGTSNFSIKNSHAQITNAFISEVSEVHFVKKSSEVAANCEYRSS